MLKVNLKNIEQFKIGKKLKRETITLEELKAIAEVMDVKFEQAFILPDGNKIKAGNE